MVARVSASSVGQAPSGSGGGLSKAVRRASLGLGGHGARKMTGEDIRGPRLDEQAPRRGRNRRGARHALMRHRIKPKREFQQRAAAGGAVAMGNNAEARRCPSAD
jgi:hypothetical protein